MAYDQIPAGGTSLTVNEQAAVDALATTPTGEAVEEFAAILGVDLAFVVVTASVTTATTGGTYA